MTVDVLVRFELKPADKSYKTPPNEMLQDLRAYLRHKEQDTSLQSNSTKLKIGSFITQVVKQ